MDNDISTIRSPEQTSPPISGVSGTFNGIYSSDYGDMGTHHAHDGPKDSASTTTRGKVRGWGEALE